MASSKSGLRPHHIADAIAAYNGPPEPGEGTDKTLTETLVLVEAENATAGRTFPCPKCSKAGQYPGSRDSGDPADNTKVSCTVCDGWGKTSVQYKAVIATYAPVE
jgi:hypothetical protein